MNVLKQIIGMDAAKAGVLHVQRRIIFLEDPSGVDTKKPNAVFPLRTVMVLVLIVGISALLSWCYHWEKIKTLYIRHTSSDFGDISFVPTGNPNLSDAHCGSSSSCNNPEIEMGGGMVAVVMPGDEKPNFIALPSPHGIISSTSVSH